MVWVVDLITARLMLKKFQETNKLIVTQHWSTYCDWKGGVKNFNTMKITYWHCNELTTKWKGSIFCLQWQWWLDMRFVICITSHTNIQATFYHHSYRSNWIQIMPRSMLSYSTDVNKNTVNSNKQISSWHTT